MRIGSVPLRVLLMIEIVANVSSRFAWRAVACQSITYVR